MLFTEFKAHFFCNFVLINAHIMRYRTHLFLLAILVLLGSCKTQEEPTQMQQVMAIHDEVMPKMGTLSKLVAQLKPLADSTETGLEYQKAMHDLQAANRSMMNWMRGFGERFDSDEILNGKPLSAEKQAWLKEEEEKVKALREEINTSIANAEQLLSSN